MAGLLDIHAILDNAHQAVVFVGVIEADINRGLWIEYPWLMRASQLVGVLGLLAFVIARFQAMACAMSRAWHDFV